MDDTLFAAAESSPATSSWIACPHAQARIKSRLAAHIPLIRHFAIIDANAAPASCASSSPGATLRLEIVSDSFEDMRPLDRQRLVHVALKEEIASGAVHAFDELLTFTPAQWARRSQEARLAWVGERIRAKVQAVQHLEVRDVTNGHAVEGFLDGSGRALDPNGLELEILVVSNVFVGMRPLARQRLVQEALGPEILSGKIHALPRLRTHTASQWIPTSGMPCRGQVLAYGETDAKAVVTASI